MARMLQSVPALVGLAGIGHAERGAEDGRFDIVDGNGIAGKHGLDVAVADEPLESARARECTSAAREPRSGTRRSGARPRGGGRGLRS
jgi:hypothetical protein